MHIAGVVTYQRSRGGVLPRMGISVGGERS